LALRSLLSPSVVAMEVAEVFMAEEGDFTAVEGFMEAVSGVVGFTVEAVSTVAADFAAEASEAEGFEADPVFAEEALAVVFVTASVVTAFGAASVSADVAGAGEEDGVVGA